MITLWDALSFECRPVRLKHIRNPVNGPILQACFCCKERFGEYYLFFVLCQQRFVLEITMCYR